MKKELGDLRVIAEALEKKTNIDSTAISEEVGDLCRIADALEAIVGVSDDSGMVAPAPALPEGGEYD